MRAVGVARVARGVSAAAGGMEDEALASLVEATLHVTRKSRKHHKRRAKAIVYEYEPLQGTRGVVAGRRGTGLLRGHSSGVFAGGAGSSGDLAGYASAGYASGGGAGYGSGGTGDDTDRGGGGSGAGADGVMATYKLLMSKEASRLTEATAPKLHEYLARRERKEMKRSCRGGEDEVGDEDARPFSP